MVDVKYSVIEMYEVMDHSSMLHFWGLIENSHPQIKEGISPTQGRALQSLYQLGQLEKCSNP